MEEYYHKAMKKLTFFFLSKPVPFNGQNYKKHKGPGTSDPLLFRLRNKFKKITLLVMIVWPSLMMCNIKRFLSYSKNYICKFIQANSWHKLFYFHLSFWMWKGREKLQKFEYLENEKSFFDKIKRIIYSFWRAIIWERVKIEKKIADTSFEDSRDKVTNTSNTSASTDSWFVQKQLFTAVPERRCSETPVAEYFLASLLERESVINVFLRSGNSNL